MFKPIQEKYTLAISLYNEFEFEKAKTIFEHLNTIYAYKIHTLYIQKCDEFISKNNPNASLEFIMLQK